jgi:hypothetical protein
MEVIVREMLSHSDNDPTHFPPRNATDLSVLAALSLEGTVSKGVSVSQSDSYVDNHAETP